MIPIPNKLLTKSRLLFAFLLFIIVQATAQQQQAINDQVWKPFVTSFNELDTDKFLELHSKDLVRSSRDSKKVLNWQQYYDAQKKGDIWSKENKRARTLELRFTERIANDDQAIDVGIYKTTNINTKGERRAFYGRFHVVLRRENGVWKILVDTDSSENNTIDEADFNAASAME